MKAPQNQDAAGLRTPPRQNREGLHTPPAQDREGLHSKAIEDEDMPNCPVCHRDVVELEEGGHRCHWCNREFPADRVSDRQQEGIKSLQETVVQQDRNVQVLRKHIETIREAIS